MLSAILLSASCGIGTISYPAGHDRLRAAWYTDAASGDAWSTFMLLSNSEIPCALPETDDPTQALLDSLALQATYTRENARIVVAWLYRYGSPDPVGRYPLSADASPALLDDLSPRVSGAWYRGIDESAATTADGLYRLYEPVSYVQGFAAEPGEFDIRRHGDDTISGEFRLDGFDVSGTFRASFCRDSDAIDLLDMLWRDTG